MKIFLSPLPWVYRFKKAGRIVLQVVFNREMAERADQAGADALIAMGAEAVQMGTRLLATPEATLHPLYKQAILTARDGDTIVHLFRQITQEAEERLQGLGARIGEGLEK